MTRIPCLLLAASLPVAAQSVTSDPIGFNKVTCLANSDTIVGVPLRKEGSLQAKLTADPVINGDFATLTLSATNLGTLNNHYLKFNSGTKDGSWFDITANSDDAVTINLNGESLTAAAEGDSVMIAEYWTLDSLFPPVASPGVQGPTTSWTETPAGSGNWVPNGHAIVPSTNTLGTGRRTEVLLPNLDAIGTNNPPEGRYYIHSGIWKKSNAGNTDFGTTIIFPDTHFRISHPTTVPYATTFRAAGEVEMAVTIIPLSTQQTTSQDNYVAVPRPLPVTLNALGLLGTPAFMASTNTLGTGRRDELLVFDNFHQLQNKAPSAVYYVHGGIWKLNNGGNADRGLEVIQAGAGVIIRKYQTATGATVFWANYPTYQ